LDFGGKGRFHTHFPDLGEHRTVFSFNASLGTIVAENTLWEIQFHINYFNSSAKIE
jgi:hypothetical protein